MFVIYSCIAVAPKQRLTTKHQCPRRSCGAGLHPELALGRGWGALFHQPHLTVRLLVAFSATRVAGWRPEFLAGHLCPGHLPKDRWPPQSSASVHPSWKDPPPITVCVVVSEACPQVQPELGEGTPGDGTAGGHPRSCLPITRSSSFCTSESPVKNNKHLHFSKKTGRHAPTKENSWGWEPEGGSGDTALQGLLCVCVSWE